MSKLFYYSTYENAHVQSVVRTAHGQSSKLVCTKARPRARSPLLWYWITSVKGPPWEYCGNCFSLMTS